MASDFPRAGGRDGRGGSDPAYRSGEFDGDEKQKRAWIHGEGEEGNTSAEQEARRPGRRPPGGGGGGGGDGGAAGFQLGRARYGRRERERDR